MTVSPSFFLPHSNDNKILLVLRLPYYGAQLNLRLMAVFLSLDFKHELHIKRFFFKLKMYKDKRNPKEDRSEYQEQRHSGRSGRQPRVVVDFRDVA